MSTSKIAFSALCILLSFSCFSQSYADYEFVEGRKYIIKVANDNKPIAGTFIKSDSAGMFIKTVKNPTEGVPFHMIESIITRRVFLKISINSTFQKGYLRDINDDEIIIDTKEGITSFKLNKITQIELMKSGIIVRSMGIGAMAVGILGYAGVPRDMAGSIGAIGVGVGAIAGLLVGTLKYSLVKKKYTDMQIFRNQFEPWLKGESVIPKVYTKMAEVAFQ